MKVLVSPHLDQLGKGESGIHTVIRSHFKYASDYDIEFVGPDDEFDVILVHAGTMDNYPRNVPLVSMLHGLYFTADYHFGGWAYGANAKVIDSIRVADVVTMPSEWTGEIIARDFRRQPVIVPHGIELDEWPVGEDRGYILAYAKNRDGVDVCDSTMSTQLAGMNADKMFVATYAKRNAGPTPANIRITGVVPYDEMKLMTRYCSVYVSPAKETFGLGALEAMASGKPILTANWGNVPSLAPHGVAGYCYQDGNIDDMQRGLEYCLEHKEVLGENARQLAAQYTWDKAMIQLRYALERAMLPRTHAVSVVIPAYNKEATLERAVKSALSQTVPVRDVIIVDDGSTDASGSVADDLAGTYPDRVKVIHQKNQGVAHARNHGIAVAAGDYVVPMDADDWIDERFVETCLPPLQKDKSVGVVYTGLQWHKPDGSTGLSQWPGEWNYDDQLKRKNQVPTCCLLRKDAWRRLGGYRQRYAPLGAGSEDAEFFTRLGAYGYRGVQSTTEGLFHYSWMSGMVTGNPAYEEVDWLAWHPWVRDEQHPIGSYATPRRHSHPVRQYDQPIVSVIIPVGPGHEQMVIDALDSLEAQTVRRWEAIVVWDCDSLYPQSLQEAYPYVRWIHQIMGRGTGYARNIGVDHARADLITFLDADDYLQPRALEMMLDKYAETGAAIYTDYIGIANVDDTSQLAENLQRDVIEHRNGRALIRYRAGEYDHSLAMRQPHPEKMYIWNNVTTLIPRAWHYEIGGFDEQMESWEDVLYWLKLAWLDKPFKRIPEPLMTYRFNTGGRRDNGIKNWDKLVQYIQVKKDELLNGM